MGDTIPRDIYGQTYPVATWPGLPSINSRDFQSHPIPYNQYHSIKLAICNCNFIRKPVKYILGQERFPGTKCHNFLFLILLIFFTGFVAKLFYFSIKSRTHRLTITCLVIVFIQKTIYHESVHSYDADRRAIDALNWGARRSVSFIAQCSDTSFCSLFDCQFFISVI